MMPIFDLIFSSYCILSALLQTPCYAIQSISGYFYKVEDHLFSYENQLIIGTPYDATFPALDAPSFNMKLNLAYMLKQAARFYFRVGSRNNLIGTIKNTDTSASKTVNTNVNRSVAS